MSSLNSIPSISNFLKLLLLSMACMPVGLLAQVDVYVIERSHLAVQTSADTVVLLYDHTNYVDDDNYFFWAGIEVNQPTITNANLVGPGWQSPLPLVYKEEDGDYSTEASYKTLDELNTAAPAGTYTFPGRTALPGP